MAASVKMLGALLLVMLLQQNVAECYSTNSMASSVLNSVAVKAVGFGTRFLTRGHPQLRKLADQLIHKRSARGDKQGAERVRQLKSWFNFLGLRKGLPILVTDMLSKRHLVTEVWGTVMKAVVKLEKKAHKSGWAAVLADTHNQDLLRHTARDVAKQTGDVFKTGAIRSMLDDVVYELRADKHIVTDALSSLLSSDVSKDLVASVQSIIQSISSAFPAGNNSASDAHHHHHDEKAEL